MFFLVFCYRWLPIVSFRTLWSVLNRQNLTNLQVLGWKEKYKNYKIFCVSSFYIEKSRRPLNWSKTVKFQNRPKNSKTVEKIVSSPVTLKDEVRSWLGLRVALEIAVLKLYQVNLQLFCNLSIASINNLKFRKIEFETYCNLRILKHWSFMPWSLYIMELHFLEL